MLLMLAVPSFAQRAPGSVQLNIPDGNWHFVTNDGSTDTPAGVGTPSGNNTLLSKKCATSSNCFVAHGDARWTGDCVTTSGQNTVSSASASFTAADNNKHIWCTDVNSADGAVYQTLCITGTFTYVSATSGTVSNNATNSCAGTAGKYFLGIGFKDTTAVQNAYAASLTSNSTFNGPPNSLVVDCGTYLVDAIPFSANANNFQHNITFSVLPWYPHCVTWMISDDFNFASCVSSVCFHFVSNGVEKSLPPDWLQQSGFGVFRDMAILGPGLLLSSQAGVTWFEPLRELRNVQIANLPGPSSTASTLIKMIYYTGGVYYCDIEPNSTNTTNPPIALDINAHNITVQGNSFYNSVGTFVQVETSNYADLIRDNYFGSVSTQTTPLINVVSGVLDTQITGNTFSLPGAANIGVQGAGNYTVTGRNILVVTNATSIGIKNLSGGQAMVGGNLYNGAGVPINNAGVLNHSYGQDWTPASTSPSVNSGTWIPLQSESGTSACTTSTKAITFTWTSANGGGYRAGAPTVVISDETTAGGVKAGSITSSGFTATCTGATDAFDYTVTPNPF